MKPKKIATATKPDRTGTDHQLPLNPPGSKEGFYESIDAVKYPEAGKMTLRPSFPSPSREKRKERHRRVGREGDGGWNEAWE